MREKAYEEVGTNYRFFARWRHAAIVGDLVVLWAVFTLSISDFNHASQIIWVIPLCASPFGVILWIIDVKTRDIYHAAIRTGACLEGDIKGFYTCIRDEVALPKGKWPIKKLTQSFALNLLFLGTSLMFLLLSIFFYCNFK